MTTGRDLWLYKEGIGFRALDPFKKGFVLIYNLL